MVMLGSCKGFLDQKPDNIYNSDEVFGDEVMIKSVFANLYGRVNYGINLNDSYSFTYIDEAAKMDGGPDNLHTYSDALWRVYDYGFVRNCNQFLQSLAETKALTDEQKKPFVPAAVSTAWRATSACSKRMLPTLPPCARKS